MRSMALENFRSFSRIELDLSGKKGTVKDHAFIYGENGSGKSNLVDAVVFLKECSGFPTGGCASHGSLRQLACGMRMVGSEGPMRLCYRFSIDGCDAEYRLEFGDDGMLAKESLEGRINSRRGLLFRLESGSEPYLVRGLVKDRARKERAMGEIAESWGERSFLSILVRELEDVDADSRQYCVNVNLLGLLDEIRSMVVVSRPCTPEIRDISLCGGSVDTESIADLDAVEGIVSRFFSGLCTDIRGAFYKREEAGGRTEYELFFRTRMYGEIREVSVLQGSRGIRRLLEILPALLCGVSGGCAFVDDIDEGIHDLMVSGIMEQAVPEIRGQLVATAHSTCLMDRLEPGNVYVIAIDYNGYKKVRCVSSVERVRKTNSIRLKYLDGSFMGIPYLADLGLQDIADLLEMKDDARD